MNRPREQWGSRTGFLLATIGGAVGIGNIWRFSYVAGENGGAAFLIIYLMFIIFIGVPLVIAELAIGRRAQGDAISAYTDDRGAGPWRLIGWIGVAAAVLILSYYAVITGWTIKYFFGAASGSLWHAAASDYGGYFSAFISQRGEPLVWQGLALAIVVTVVAGGVRNGIERINRMLIPILAIIVIGLAGYALSLPGAGAGVRFLFSPDWSAFGQPEVYAAALGQAFFTLGIGMVFFVTYGSYMPRTFSLASSAGLIAVGDTLFAVIAGLAIFPAVFALGGNPAAGPELIFITLPQIFLKMPGGTVVGSVFFFLLATAAMTSMIALLEIPVAALMHQRNAARRVAALGMGAVVFLIGVPSALSYGLLSHIQLGSRGILDAIDFGASNFLLPLAGIFTALYVGWRLDRALVLAETGLGARWFGLTWLWLIRIVVPIVVMLILFRSAETL